METVDCEVEWNICSDDVCIEVDCIEAEDCANNPDGNYCFENDCVFCVGDDDCCNGVCVENDCVACCEDVDCVSNICVEGTCVSCCEDNDCEDRLVQFYCSEEFVCVLCGDDDDCEGEQVCLGSRCVDPMGICDMLAQILFGAVIIGSIVSSMYNIV